MTPGTTPERRRERAAPLPVVLRVCACRDALLAMVVFLFLNQSNSELTDWSLCV